LSDRAIEIPESWGALSTLTITVSQVIVVAVTLVLLFIMRHIVLHTKTGMAMRAVSFNPLAAQLMGINIDFVISFTFGLGSALAVPRVSSLPSSSRASIH
jgi:branched-subunit amino acid ABC-type transport system permease component